MSPSCSAGSLGQALASLGFGLLPCERWGSSWCAPGSPSALSLETVVSRGVRLTRAAGGLSGLPNLQSPHP